MEPDKKPTPHEGASKPVMPGELQMDNQARTERDQEEETNRWQNWRSAVSTILLFALAPLTALFIAAFLVQSYQVDGQSMETTLQNSDRLIVDKVPRTWARLTKHDYIPPRGAIIIFNEQLDLGAGLENKQLVKRVIGLPGERVVVNNGKVTVYNQQHPEGFDPDHSGLYYMPAPTTPGQVDVTLGPHELFVSGDNRPNSEDSRYFGPIKANQIVGRLSFRILPLSKVHHY